MQLCFIVAGLAREFRGSEFSCCVKPLMAVMSLQGAALINAKHSSYYLINTKLPLSGTTLRPFIEQFLCMLLCTGIIRPIHCISGRMGEKSAAKPEFGNNYFCKPTTLSMLCILVNPVKRQHSGE